MEIDEDRYPDSYIYRLRVSLHFLRAQNESLREHSLESMRKSIVRSGVLIVAISGLLYYFSASLRTYGLALVGLGATTLAWTAFRVHEKKFREAALVPDDRIGDTPYRESVSMASQNYIDALVGVTLIIAGYSVRISHLIL